MIIKLRILNYSNISLNLLFPFAKIILKTAKLIKINKEIKITL